jgi:hypothetical protein
VLHRLHYRADVGSRNPRYLEENTMSKKTTAAAKTTTTGTRFDAYTVREYEGADGETKGDWSPIGVGFPHKDNRGFNVILHALPVDGKLVLRLHEPKDDSAE